jgi:hypothetical protein
LCEYKYCLSRFCFCYDKFICVHFLFHVISSILFSSFCLCLFSLFGLSLTWPLLMNVCNTVVLLYLAY